MWNQYLKIAETEIQQYKVYLVEAIRYALKVGEKDVLEWFVEDGRMMVAKKEQKQ